MTIEHIDIPQRQAEFIRTIIAEGHFGDVNEVIRASVLLLEERLAFEKQQKDKLRQLLDDALAEGLSDRTPEEVWDTAEAKHLQQTV